MPMGQTKAAMTIRACGAVTQQQLLTTSSCATPFSRFLRSALWADACRTARMDVVDGMDVLARTKMDTAFAYGTDNHPMVTRKPQCAGLM